MDYPLFLPSQAVTQLLTPAAADMAAADMAAAVDSEVVVDSAVEESFALRAWVVSGAADSVDLRWADSAVARPWVVFAAGAFLVGASAA